MKGVFINQLVAALALTASLFAAANAVPQDFLCHSADPASQIEVPYERDEPTYSTGQDVDVKVIRKADSGRPLRLYGVATNLVFAGGGTQTVAVEV
jgi:hypothetical protein